MWLILIILFIGLPVTIILDQDYKQQIQVMKEQIQDIPSLWRKKTLSLHRIGDNGWIKSRYITNNT